MEDQKPGTDSNTAAPSYDRLLLKSALHGAVWFAHKCGAAIADIEHVFAEVIADVKAEFAAVEHTIEDGDRG